MEEKRERKSPGVCGFRGPKKHHSSEDTAAPECLREPEEDFFTVIATGNIGTFRKFMKKHRKPDGRLDFDVNCTNFQNDTAMTVAVDKSNLEMIRCLVQVMNVTKNSILLKAIHRGDFDLVKGLCECLSADEEALSGDYKVSVGETDYPFGTTPLMVAATEGHYEIVGYLVDRGHQIAQPHRPGCMCQDCHTVLKLADQLCLSSEQSRIYAALSSPSYIPYATADPINYCFKIHQRLTSLSNIDQPFRSHYTALAEQVSTFAANLVSECRNFKEVELVLKQCQTRDKHQSTYPRLLMAINLDQTDFITQPKVQLFVQWKFYGAFEDWRYFNNFQKLYIVFVRIVTAPIAFMMFLTNPKSQKAAYYAAPINKMLHFLSLYLVFLFLLFVETREPKPIEHQNKMNSVWTYWIYLYFYSYTGLIVYQILTSGLKSFLHRRWNVYDLVMVSFFGLFVAFSISSLVHVRMSMVDCAERKYWSWFDPQLMAEGFLVLATLMAYLKLLFFFQAHSTFGPLLVSLYRLTKYLGWFLFFGAIVLLGYSVAFSHFYSYYSGMSYVDPETKAKSMQEESFTDVLSSLKTFFWGIFGLSHSSAADVVLENDNEHVFTEMVGYAALGSFLLLMLLVFKSMLIAMAAKTYQDADAHKTWLLKRTLVFLYFIDLPLLPPPLNLLPHRYSETKNCMCDLEKAIDPNPQLQYKDLTKELVERYFATKLKRQERSTATHPDSRIEDLSKLCHRSRCRSL